MEPNVLEGFLFEEKIHYCILFKLILVFIQIIEKLYFIFIQISRKISEKSNQNRIIFI